MMLGRDCASIGYQGKSIEYLCDLLLGHDIEQVIDVRAAAWSHRPSYRRTALAWCLNAAGLEYMHFKAAGNPFRPRKGEVLTPAACVARYAQYLSAQPIIVDDLLHFVSVKRSALFCYEEASDQCHRGVLLHALRKRDPSLQVVEI